MQSKTKSILLGKVFTFFVLTMPISNCYVSPLPPLGVGEFILLLFMPIMLLNMLQKHKTIIWHKYWLFIIYGIVISLIVVLFNPSIIFLEVGKRLIRDIFYVCCIFIFAQEFFVVEYAIKLYKVLVIITCTYVVLQCISFYMFGYVLPWKIPGIDFNVSQTTDAYMHHYELMYAQSFRPTSIFTEPAQFAQFSAPYLLLLLFLPNKNKKIDIKLAIFISSALLLSTSANGYIFLLAIWAMWFFYNILVLKRNKSIIGQLLVIFIIVVALSYLYNNNNVFAEVINRYTNIGGSTTNSENLRLLRGFYYFSALDPLYQFFGVGFGSIDNFTLAHSVSTPYDIGNEYMSGLSYILVSAGIVGFIMYLSIMYMIFKKGTVSGKSLIILLLIMLTSSSVYSEAVYLVILAFALYLPPCVRIGGFVEEKNANLVSVEGVKSDVDHGLKSWFSGLFS